MESIPQTYPTSKSTQPIGNHWVIENRGIAKRSHLSPIYPTDQMPEPIDNHNVMEKRGIENGVPIGKSTKEESNKSRLHTSIYTGKNTLKYISPYIFYPLVFCNLLYSKGLSYFRSGIFLGDRMGIDSRSTLCNPLVFNCLGSLPILYNEVSYG